MTASSAVMMRITEIRAALYWLEQEDDRVKRGHDER